MKDNGIYEDETTATLSESSFEGDGQTDDTQLEFDENQAETDDIDDYADVSSEHSLESEDNEENDTTDGGSISSEAAMDEDTLERVPGYDYSEVETALQENATEDEDQALDAYYAEYGDPTTGALLQTESGQKMLQEVVIGKDDRKKITATKSYPWRAICSLKVKAKDGTHWIGTGFFIGPRTVITAGHVVYMRKHGGWAKSIEVIPGRNGSSKPFGSCTSSQFHSVKGWTKSNKRSHDYGAIILPKNCKLGNKTGYFGYANYSFFKLMGRKVNLSGYPGDQPAGTQWWHARRIKAVFARTFSYNIDTYGGQSGSPVWMKKGKKRYVVGIHTNGSKLGNSATRITKPVFKNLKNWKNKYK